MKLYKREGRKFVACELIDNTGKYYQLDGTFSNCKTEESVGLCISSSVTEDIIMYLKDGEFKLGAIPTSTIMIIALLEFRQKLNLSSYTTYNCIDSVTCELGNAYELGDVYVANDGLVYHNSNAIAIYGKGHTRQIIKVRKC